jgi:hypothetical protein
MSIKFVISLFSVLLQLSVCLTTKGQIAFSDSSFLSAGLNNVISAYHHATKEQSHLYNGIEYVGYPFKLDKGHLFFKQKEMSNGTIKYDGVSYSNVPMVYDLHKGAVIVAYLYDNIRIQLIKEKVESFSLLGHTYKRIEKDSSQTYFPGNDYYDMLYEGDISVLAQRGKLVVESANTSGVERIIQDKISYYLLKDKIYQKFNGKKAFLNLLKDDKKRIKTYMREHKIKFRKDKEGSMVLIARFYDQLKS